MCGLCYGAGGRSAAARRAGAEAYQLLRESKFKRKLAYIIKIQFSNLNDI